MPPASDGYLSPAFTAMAHRGGALLPENLGIENTLESFRNAVALGYEYLETDVHATRDGKLVAFHDTSLLRVTDVDVDLHDLTLDELREIRVGGRAGIPTLAELLEEFPDCRFNLDMKADASVELLVDAIRSHGAQERVCVGSFSSRRLRRFRRLLPGVTTSASPTEVVGALVGLHGRRETGPDVFQVPIRHHVGPIPVPVVTRRMVQSSHLAGRRVHVWTVDEPLVMHELIDMGVDGIITDRPDVLKGVLRDRGMWSTRN